MEIPEFKFVLRNDLKEDKQFLPVRGESKATGWDVAAALEDGQKQLVIKPGEWVKIPLGFRCFIPDGWWLSLYPRSSTAAKKNMHALYGVLDNLYEGSCVFCAQYLPNDFVDNLECDIEEYYSYGSDDKQYRGQITNRSENLIINHGDKIGQLIPVRRQEMIVSEISEKEFDKLCQERGGERGAKGFGSTSETK